MNRFATLVLLLIASVSMMPIAFADAASGETAVYDAYMMGIHVGKLRVEHREESRVYSISKRDFHTRVWSDTVTAFEEDLADNEAFELWGSIAGLPARMQELQNIDWASLESVVWPDPQTIYDRHRQLETSVDGKSVSAWYWAQRDATRPMDLVFDSGNRLIAGIDVTVDFVLVRRGFEGFTTVGRWREPTVSQPDYGVRELGKIMVEMPDGTKLATLVYLPDGDTEGPFPTVLIRTP